MRTVAVRSKNMGAARIITSLKVAFFAASFSTAPPASHAQALGFLMAPRGGQLPGVHTSSQPHQCALQIKHIHAPSLCSPSWCKRGSCFPSLATAVFLRFSMALAIQAMGRQNIMAKNMSAVEAHGFLKYFARPSKSSPSVWYTAEQVYRIFQQAASTSTIRDEGTHQITCMASDVAM